jgi:hypothetical protein
MSAKPDYDAQEWQLLIDVPPLVGTAVMVAGRSGLGTMKEAFAVASGVMSAREGYEGNALIQALIDGRIKDKDRSSVERRGAEIRGKSPEELIDFALDKCQQVVALLQAKSTDQEAGEYKAWALAVGEKVANAAKEGGFLGIGGERVSQAERDVLQKISQALSLT